METSQLIELKKLLDEGAITEDEFAAKKRELLDANAGKATPAKLSAQPQRIASIVLAGIAVCLSFINAVSSLLGVAPTGGRAFGLDPSFVLFLTTIPGGVLLILANLKPDNKGVRTAAIVLTAIPVVLSLLMIGALMQWPLRLIPTISLLIALVLTLVKK